MARRSKRGNMLALIAAFCILMVVVLLFALGYVRLLGTSSEQKTAIEAAALAAAREISKIVINTPEFGYIGLSDSAPNGSLTIAGDDFDTPVHSINTLIGTARLDYIIADALGSDGDEIKELALRDLAAAKTRANELITRIEDALAPGGSERDKNNAEITPYTAAETAYTQNVIRIAGKCDYVPGSMQLTLGALENGAATNIPVPKPLSSDPSLDSSNTIVARTYDHFSGNWVNETYYKSYTSYPFDGQDFVFAAIGDSVRLVDPNLWRPTLTGLPYYYRTVVRAEALETVQDPDRTHTLKAVACAQPSNVYDPKPVPGALQISFPDGMPSGPEYFANPRSLYGTTNNMENSGVGVDLYTADNGDFPVTTGSTIESDNANWPVPSDTSQTAATACKIAVYDWLKRAGTKANVTSVVGMHSTPFKRVTDPPLSLSALVPLGNPIAGSVPRGICHMYFFDSDGVVSYDVKEQKPQPYYVVAESQAYMESFRPIEDGHPTSEQIELTGLTLGPPINAAADGVVVLGPAYDMYIRLYSRKPGPLNGGRHAGEPMDNIWLVTQKPPQVNLHGTSGAASVNSISMSGRGAGGNMNGHKNKNKGKDSGPMGPGTEGVPPAIIGRRDFPQSSPTVIDRTNLSLYEKYDDTGGGPRLTYKSYSTGGTGDGTTSDIRFRRVLDIYKESAPSTVESGYIGLK